MELLALLVAALLPLTATSDTTHPVAYYLKITVPDLSSKTSFNGVASIDIKVPSPVKLITLDALNLVLNTPLQVKKLNGGTAESDVVFSDVTIGFSTLNITFARPIPTGDYRVTADYQGLLHDRMQGFARVKYHFGGTERFLAVTRLAPAFAREVFPCYDDPEVRTPLTLEVVVNNSLTVLSNVRPTNVSPLDDISKVFKFESPAMPVNQLGWLVLDHSTYFINTVNSTSGVEVHTRVPRLYTNLTTWAGTLTAQLADAMGSYTGTPYPLGKLEQVVVPEFFEGSTEAWGLMTFSEESLLVSPEKSSAQDAQDVSLTVARAVSCQWFGSLISAQSWEEEWLQQGLAEYLKYTVSASLSEMSGWELADQEVLGLTQHALSLDGSDRHALAVSSQSSADEAYDQLTRCKGGAIIRMLHSIVGDSAFKAALVTFIKNSANNTGALQSMWDALYEESYNSGVEMPDTLNTIFTPWTTLPSYPVVNVTRNSTHYLLSQDKTNAWFIPVSYLLQDGKVGSVWILPGSSVAVAASSSQWILLNVNQTGLYRVSYDAEVLAALTQQLQSNPQQIPRLSRAQLLDDCFSLPLDPDSLMQLTSYLAKETDYYPWHTALRHFRALVDTVYERPAHQLLEDYLLRLLEHVLAAAGTEHRPEDSHVDRLRRTLVMEASCALGSTSCAQHALTILRSWTASTYFDGDLNMALFCAGVRAGPEALWRSVWRTYHVSVFPTIRAHILRALTCSSNVPLLKEFLDNVTSTSANFVSAKDKAIVLETLGSRPEGAQVLLGWLLERLYAQMNMTVMVFSHTHQVEVQLDTDLATSDVTGTNKTEDVGVAGHPDSSSEEESTVPHTRVTRAAHITERLADEDVARIMEYALPRLTTLEQGNALDAFLAQNNTGLKNATLELLIRATMQIYKQATLASHKNAPLTVWLEKALATTPEVVQPTGGGSTAPGGVTSPPQTGAAALTLPSLLVTLLALTTPLRLLL